MKVAAILIFCILFLNDTNSQILGQDKEGFSSIIQPSSSFNLDIAEKVATLNFYQENWIINNNKQETKKNEICDTEDLCLIHSTSLDDYVKKLKAFWKQDASNSKQLGLVYGIDLKGSSSDGIAMLINEEQLLTSSAISGMIGLRWHKRSYNNKLNDYAQKNYNSIGQEKKEQELIKAILNEIKKITDQKIISKQRQNDLLFFKKIISDKDKIQNLEYVLNSIEERQEFVKIENEVKLFSNRLDTLKLMEQDILAIKTLALNYQTSNAAYQKEINATTEELVNIRLIELKSCVAGFEQKLTSKSIESLKLELDYKEFRNPDKWDALKVKVTNIREDTALELSNIKEISKAPESSLDATCNSYENYKKFLTEEKISFEDLQIAKAHTYTIQRNLFYFKGGFLGSSFKYDLANDSTSISDRFITKDFQGYRLELGYTRQFKRYNFLGLNLAMSRSSNAADLTSTSYKMETTDTSVTPNITAGSEITALSGPFDTFLKYGLSFDYVRLVPFHDSNATEDEIKKSKLLLSINPYIRHSFYDKSETLKPNTSLGLGLYSFNKTSGSIAGGVFIQADDIFNVNRKEAINFTKQISFGLVFKLAIKSFDPVNN